MSDAMSDAMPGLAAWYPVSCGVEPQTTERARASVAFRIILAIPHLLIVGGVGLVGFGIGGLRWAGALAAAALAMAVVSWFSVVFTGRHPRGLWDFAYFYVRWWVRATAYLTLLRDEYPPFGDGPYPAVVEVSYPEEPRDRLSVGLRFLYLIPHAVVLFFLNVAWFVTTVIAWFSVVFTGSFPDSLYQFGVGVLRWNARVQCYALLLRDEYPPFRLEP